MKTCILYTAGLSLLLAFPGFAMNDPVSADPIGIAENVPSVKISPFCQAIVQGDTARVAQLIALGEDVNRKSLGKTPLIFAARYNRTEIIALLLDSGADPKLRCDRGHTALEHAELSNAHEAASLLKNAMKA